MDDLYCVTQVNLVEAMNWNRWISAPLPPGFRFPEELFNRCEVWCGNRLAISLHPLATAKSQFPVFI